MNTRTLIIALLVAIILPFAASAQCKGFVKKTCLPKVPPYTHNGQLNNAVMSAGEKAELQMTFYSGQEYRIVVCAQEVLGKVSFKVYDSSHKEIYSSDDGKDEPKWDFKVVATQQLTLEIEAPALDSPNSLVPSGCVSVLVGFKK
jgi:hypothetical protein